MKVAELQQFLRSLVGALAAAGGKQAAGDLERAAAGLQPFQAMTVAEFADFLAQADTYKRDGTLPVKSGGKAKAAVDTGKVQEAAQKIQALYERAADPALSHAEIEAEVKKLSKLGKDSVIALAREFGIEQAVKSMKAAQEQIKLKIATRKESFERTQFRQEPTGMR